MFLDTNAAHTKPVGGVWGAWAILCGQGWHYMTGNLPVRLHWSLLVLLEINMYLGTYY